LTNLRVKDHYIGWRARSVVRQIYTAD